MPRAGADGRGLNLNTRTGTDRTFPAIRIAKPRRRPTIVLLSIPYAGMQPILEDVRAAAQGQDRDQHRRRALDPERKSRAKIPAAGSVTAEVQQFFGDTVRVVAAFQNISPEKLEAVGDKIDSDVLVCGGDKEGARARDRPDPNGSAPDALDAGGARQRPWRSRP